MKEDTIITLLQAVLEQIEMINSEKNDGVSQSDPELAEKVLLILDQIAESRNVQKEFNFRTESILKDIQAKAKSSYKNWDPKKIDELLVKIKGISIPKEVKVIEERKISLKDSTLRFSIGLNTVAVLSIFGSFLYSDWSITERSQVAEKQIREAKFLKNSYRGFPSPEQFNWFVGFHEFMLNEHPRDTKNYEMEEPYPRKK